MTTIAAPNRKKTAGSRRARINWPLWLGLILVGTITYLAIMGPSLAPKDPLAENMIVRDEETGEWHIPPFTAFEVTGFPLGSDEFGRDLYSRLLYAIRPTLQMVMLVAGVRLLLGTLIGLVAGWSTGRIGSLFDSLISGALALPALLVALGAIAVVGVELGVIAFIIGLSITGWAETARIVREQTRTIRSEVYVEAAHALGESDAQIVFGHVLRQIRSMLLMLFAFEVGSTLMLTAGLGFLGYYIGGDVWVEVDDFVARRTSGTPELGQMLATAWTRLTEYSGLVSVGSVVFASVLGFNLIGEGLRLRSNPEMQVGRIRWLSDAMARLKLNLAQAWYPVDRLLFGSRIAVSFWMLALGVLAGYGGMTGWQKGLFRLPETDRSLFFADEPTAAPTSPAASSGGQSSGGTAGPATPEPSADASPTPLPLVAMAWSYTAPDRLLVPPLIHPNGSVYLLTEAGSFYVVGPDGAVAHTVELPEPVYELAQSGFGVAGPTAGSIPFPPILAPDGSIVVASADRLYSVGLDGTIIWEAALDDEPYSPPISGPDHTTYYQLDASGTLYAFSPSDGLLWKHSLEAGFRPAFFFPVFGPDGSVYYSITNGTRGQIEALGQDGTPLWRTTLTTFNFYRPIQITPNGDWISLDDNVVRTDTGELIELADTDFRIDQFSMGQDGKTYLLSGSTLMEWSLIAGGRLSINRQMTVAIPPTAASGQSPLVTVAPDDTAWFRFFGAQGNPVIYVWADWDGTVFNIITINQRDTFILEEDYAQTGLTVCGVNREMDRFTCRRYEKGIADPVWEIAIGDIENAESVFYENGMLYVQVGRDSIQVYPVELP